MKRSSHDSILAACVVSWRPMRERKVDTSGTKGVGFGTRRVCAVDEARRRAQDVQTEEGA